ncbi:MAG: RimK/LysX family protein [Gammaproteobacteria bacterium]|nr:RimK/LysX family protein [Gammaproteobacteria bacterium]
MKTLYIFPLLSMLLLVEQSAMAKEVVGWLEQAQLHFNGDTLAMMARIDSGAKTSSIHSKDYKLFHKDGQQWIRFRVGNFKSDEMLIERPIVRMSKIKGHFGEIQVRPVIKIGLCLGRVFRETEVNLVDRTGFNYPLLVGRAFLAGYFLIDSDAKLTTRSDCSKGT